MGGIQVAETSAAKKRSKKTLDHIEIHPKMGGGHIVKHSYSGYDHEPKEVQFNADGNAAGGEHILSHLQKHAGLPGLERTAEPGGSEVEG